MMGNVGNKAYDEARKRSREQLLAGGLPLSAEERLLRLSQNLGLTTSDLSVNEFVLCASIGVRPLGQVTGSTVYQLGWQSPPLYSAELTYVTQAYLKAQHLVFGRIQQGAELLGADGVIGIRLEQTKIRAGQNLMEWKASGTAIAIEGRAEAGKDVRKPFLCGLSGQEFWALRQAGYSPVGLVCGVCGFYQKGDCRFRFDLGMRTPNSAYPVQSRAYSRWDNREDAGLTAGIYQARAQAMRRLEGEAIRQGADGVVGVQWEMQTKLSEVDDLNETFRQDAYLSVAVLGTTITSAGSKRPTIDYSLPLT